MQYHVWWQTNSAEEVSCPPLAQELETDCLVIGAGMAGLHAALRLITAGKDVVLLEKSTSGGSSTGRSAGFLTPESEEDFQKLINRYGKERANEIYEIPLQGVNLILDTIRENKFNCDLRRQDTLYFSNKPSHNSTIEEEAETREENDLPFELLNREDLKKIHPGRGYLKALRYEGSYGIDPLAYARELKKLLLKKGVQFFEESEVHALQGNTAKTHLGSVTAKNVLICMDKLKTEVNEEFSKKYYHIQSYVAVSEPLTDKEMDAVFPAGELMCWDTRWDYIHYRPIAGNRILIGGSSPWTAYKSDLHHSPRVISSFISKLKKAFPAINDADFNYYWSGLIDVTKDLVPIVDYDPRNKSIQYALGCAGLNWAAYCGDYMARRLVDPENVKDLSEFLGADRKFWVSEGVQRILGKRISFFINHLYELLHNA
jgi:gamma-glutamylputrescine oxidase